MNLKNVWKWDGQSIFGILEKCSIHEVHEMDIQEWKSTIPADIQEPVVVSAKVSGHRKKWEMARVLAVDSKEQALLRMFDAASRFGWKYTVIPVSEVRKFFSKCRKQFNNN
jgi:hypothetical protein